MGAGGTWRAVFRKHVLIAFTGEDLFFKQQNIRVCDRGGAITRTRGACVSRRLQQLIGIDVDSDGDVFGEWELVERFADKSAQAHDGIAADQNVKSELAL
jgi:hypothetical protein